MECRRLDAVFTLIATEHVFEHSYAANILGFDETNLIDLNWYVFAGIIAGCGFTYFTFALRKWRYKTMTAIGFALAVIYLAYFYFFLDYGVEKEALFVSLFARGAASVIISIVYLTSILQGGLPFMVFPQALTVNGFTGEVMGATFQSGFRRHAAIRPVRHGTAAGDGGLDERDIWMAVDCRYIRSASDSSQLQSDTACCHTAEMVHYPEGDQAVGSQRTPNSSAMSIILSVQCYP